MNRGLCIQQAVVKSKRKKIHKMLGKRLNAHKIV